MARLVVKLGSSVVADPAGELRAGVLAAVRAGGFREYFDPTTGDGRGAADFGWSAALVLDLLAAP